MLNCHFIPRSRGLLSSLSLGLAIACSASNFATAAELDASGAAGQTRTLAGRDLTVNIKVVSGHFAGVAVKDRVSGRTLAIPEAFILTMKDHSLLRSTEMQVSPLPSERTGRSADTTGPKGPNGAATRACWKFRPSPVQAQLEWCAVMRPAATYLRETLTIQASNRDLPIAEVRLLDFADSHARAMGVVKGSPVVSENLFYGFEHPLSITSIEGGRVQARLRRELPLLAGQSVSYSAVLGTSQPGQLRRAFLAYLENERPRRFQPFLHYNSWYDIGYTNRFDEAAAIDRIRAFGTELHERRQVQLDSFLFDDGWDDTNSLWGFDSGFPHGFTNVAMQASKFRAGIGVWMSPWGGYEKEKEQRVAYGKQHGYEIVNGGYALSGPKYYRQFEKTCLEMIDRYHVNQFKFDGTGNANSTFPGSSFDSDFDAAIHLIARIRQQKPGIFINLTTGTTPSPFWLFYADSIWRGGEDHDFAGEGSPRQRWVTYRDGQTYRNIVQKGPLFPLNSLMLHGIIYAKQAHDLGTDPRNDFADEVHSYFASGTQLQEMYITPSLLTAANWDTLAAAARWSRAHADTLKDVHWIGGDPQQLQVYGWAAWAPHEGIVTLRNPSSHQQSFEVNLGRAFELPSGAAESYRLLTRWGLTEMAPETIRRKDQSIRVNLAPFEVRTLEATPVH